MIHRILYRPFFIRLLHWEYWSFHAVYGFIYPYWILLCLRARSFFFFNVANPAILNGGMLMESKKSIYDMIPEQYYPRTLFFEKNTGSVQFLQKIYSEQLRFPLIAKPDIGMKGLCVKKINDEAALLAYAAGSKVNFLVQEFIQFKEEAGIFYYRYPGETKGHISGIVGKQFLTVTGDGFSTIRELLQQDKRFILQLPELEKSMNNLDWILEVEEEYLLVPYGNHARGARFVDLSHLIDEELTESIDRVCTQVKGFYYGRLDIRYNTWEELRQGKNFSIIELNGAGSEPAHIYDPGHTIFFAWKEIIRHWNILSRISRQNRRLLDKPYMSLSEGIQMFRDNRQYLKLINGKCENVEM
jgi:hypothetical protein